MPRYTRYSLVSLALLVTSFLLAAGGGKISGRVTTATGEPLPGANVIIQGTGLGAATDTNGEYFVLNIPPGRYTVAISMIGYRTLIQEEVLVVTEFTTALSAALEQATLEAEEVVVVAKRPLIRKDITSSVVIITGDEIINMPVANFKDILATQAGFTTDAEGELHVRGGRAKEILYIVDGMIVKDPLGGDFTGAVSQNAIQEMTVISGTFNAEYGEAMSSVVNIVTREGGQQLEGRLEYISGFLGASPYHQRFAFQGVEDSLYSYTDLREPLLGYYDEGRANNTYPSAFIPLQNLNIPGTTNLTLSGPLPLPRTTYFLSAQYDQIDSHLPHGVRIGQDVQLKLTGRISPKLKLAAHLQSASRLSQDYLHKWKNLPENQAHRFRATNRAALTLTHTLGAPVYYTLSLWRLDVGTRVGVRNLRPEEYEEFGTDKNNAFYIKGNSKTYSLDQSTTLGIKWDLVDQLNQRHQLKTGFTVKRHNLDLYLREEPWINGVDLNDSTTFTPLEGAFYVQDKIEYRYIIVNLGVRYDYLDPNASMWEQIRHHIVQDAEGNWVPAPEYDVSPRTQWSPRVGISYPASDKTIFHFSYGHFLQFPNFDAITHNSGRDLGATLPLVGNPAANAEKTAAFETGLKYAPTNNMAVSVTAWSKDITDLLSTLLVRYRSRKYIVYTNADYASVKGIDLALRLRGSRLLSGSLGYTLSVAKGNNSDPLGGYFSAYTLEEVPHQEYYLDFDQRHDFSLNLNLNTRGSSPGRLTVFSGITANLLITAGSGLPYTPYVDPTFRVPINSARKPYTFSADLRLRKRISVGGVNLEGLLQVINLTDHQNVLWVYSRTGKPFDPGFVGAIGAADYNHDPSNVGTPRQIKAGLNVNW